MPPCPDARVVIVVIVVIVNVICTDASRPPPDCVDDRNAVPAAAADAPPM